MSTKKEFAYCPDCEATLRLKSVHLGQQITCRECGTLLEVVELNPIELDWVFDEAIEEELDDDAGSALSEDSSSNCLVKSLFSA